MDTKTRVLFLIFPNFNTLDLNGPQEVLKNYALGKTEEEQKFEISIAAADEITTAFEKVQIKRDISFEDALKDISYFDVMIVAGGPPEAVTAAIATGYDTKMLDLIRTFTTSHVWRHHTKWLVSICTGAGFLGTIGIFAGKTVTTHFGYIASLQKICDEYSKTYKQPETKVVRQRWVNAGALRADIKVLTSGGVSCGIDCCLWLVSQIVGMDEANSVALMMDYDWKYPRPGVTVGQMV